MKLQKINYENVDFGATFIMMKEIASKNRLIGLYRGATPNLAGATASWDFIFTCKLRNFTF